MDRMSEQAAELIVYACPSGLLAGQVTRYFERSRGAVGANAAHSYMPHVTLTGFFHDDAASIPRYREALARALARTPLPDVDAVRVEGMWLTAEFHYLKIESPWLIALTAAFAQTADSATRRDALRRKDWLHLSLAYQFPAEQHAPLAALASALIDPLAPAGWDLRLYQRVAADWIMHGQWQLVPQPAA